MSRYRSKRIIDSGPQKGKTIVNTLSMQQKLTVVTALIREIRYAVSNE